MDVFESVDLGIGWPYLLWGVAAYLLGSVSLGDIVARAAGFPIRNVGTGNPGTANIFREMGTRYATLVLVLDMLKGSAAMLPMFVFDVTAWAGMVGAGGVLAGHYLPIFWNFNPPNGVVGVEEREIRDMEERLSGRFWTVGAGERLATVMWSSPTRDRTQQKTLTGRSGAGLGRVWVTLG